MKEGSRLLIELDLDQGPYRLYCSFPGPGKFWKGRRFSKQLWKSFGILCGKILKYAKMDIA